MLEYTLDDAEMLLSKNLQTATKNLNQLEIDLDFLRDQLTTTEVSILLLGNMMELILYLFVYVCMLVLKLYFLK